MQWVGRGKAVRTCEQSRAAFRFDDGILIPRALAGYCLLPSRPSGTADWAGGVLGTQGGVLGSKGGALGARGGGRVKTLRQSNPSVWRETLHDFTGFHFIHFTVVPEG